MADFLRYNNRLWIDQSGERIFIINPDTPDHVIERILRGNQAERDLYVLLTALLRHGDARLIRAAEVNLRSLLKQARTATIPWEQRPSGHFEPPSD